MRRIDNFFHSVVLLCIVLILVGAIAGAYQAFFGPQEGYITRKSYTPASYNNAGTPQYISEKYILTIQNTDETHNFIYVDSVTFHEVELNDFFSKKCMCVVSR